VDIYENYINNACKMVEGRIARQFFECMGMSEKDSKLIEIMLKNEIPLEKFLKSLQEYSEWLKKQEDEDDN